MSFISRVLRRKTNSTFYTHYTALSTVQANWGLKSLGRGDTNATLNNVIDFVAKKANWTNNGLTGNSSSIRTSLLPPFRPPEKAVF